jgi:type I restriction enzyme R subunit
VSYIIALLRNMMVSKPADRPKQRKAILDMLDTDAQLRSKKELIARFIADHFPNIPASADVGDKFEAYWDEEKQKAVAKISEEEDLSSEGLQAVIGNYLFTEKAPMRDDVIEIMNKRPSLRERGSIAERVISKIREYVETFIDGVD